VDVQPVQKLGAKPALPQRLVHIAMNGAVIHGPTVHGTALIIGESDREKSKHRSCVGIS
jgi:hypothetical protein